MSRLRPLSKYTAPMIASKTLPRASTVKLRKYILQNGGYIQRDYTFEDGKFYDVIVGGLLEAGMPACAEYTEAEYEFGRENLAYMPAAFVKRTKKHIANIEKYLKQPNLQEESRQSLILRKERLQGVLDGEVK